MIETLFPLGISQYLIGGVLVGLGIAIPFIFTGLVAGASTVFTATWSYVHKGAFFQSPGFLNTRHWRLTLTLGLMTGGLIFVYLLNEGSAVVTSLQPWRLFVGGVLIGIGTRMSGGCTSGHGICGNAALEKVSFIATGTFLLVAIATANLVKLIF